jgi:Asp/Glu/hydantoin racemase
VVKGASVSRVVKECDPALIQPFIEGAQELEREGVKAISTSCGFLAAFQRQIADAISIPVFTSSLLQVPMARAIIRADQKVGIITARAKSLTEKHLAAVGVQNVPMVVVGMDASPGEFYCTFIENKADLDPELAAEDIKTVARNLVKEHPEVGAIVLEGTNFTPFTHWIQKETGRPVFDVITLIKHAYSAVMHRPFEGVM